MRVHKILAVVASLILTACAGAQTSARKPVTGPPPVPLTPAADSVLKTLESLEFLPVGGWKYHAGDVDHGEDPTLDDSSWKTVDKGFKAPRAAVWFRREVEVPKAFKGYDLSGARVWFSFNIDANGPMPLIIYFNGRRVALGEDLEPIVLFDKAQPGDKVLVAVKALYTVDEKSFQGAEADVQFSEARPNPFAFATEARCADILLPSMHPGDKQAGAQLNAAIEKVSLAALSSADQAQFDASLISAQEGLIGLRPLLQHVKVDDAGNAHIDAAWLWPMSETIDVVRRTFGTALQLMHEYDGYTFTQSAAQYSEWMEQKYPQQFAEIQERVKQRRWEMVGGMWIEPDLNMPDGESLVRQLLIGKRYFKDKFGVDVTVGWNPDSFGYNWQLPQIYKKSGVDYFVTQKMWWNDTNFLPLKLFWWQSPDGSRVLTYFPHDYVNAIEPVRIAKDFAAARMENPGSEEMLHLYGIGDHGGGPTRAMLDAAEGWMNPDFVSRKMMKNYTRDVDPRAPVLRWSFAATFFADMLPKVDTAHAPVWNYGTLAAGNAKLPEPPPGKVSLPVWNDELYLEYHRGVFTTQAKHKQNMRDSEEWLLNAEKWSSLAWLDGLPYPADKLNEAWKKVLLNQFHDLAAGSGIGVIYKDAQKDYDVVHWTANDAQRNSMAALDSRIDTQTPAKFQHAVPVIVWNPLAWKRTDLARSVVEMPVTSDGVEVVDSNGKRMASFYAKSQSSAAMRVNFVAEDVPSLGYKVFYVVPSNARRETVKETRFSAPIQFENEYLSVTVNPANGCITHLVSRKSGFDAIASGGCGNQLQTFKDTPKEYDAWNIDPGTLDHFTPVEALDSISFLPDDGFTTGVTIERRFGDSKITQSIGLLHGIDRVTVTNAVDWHETHVLLKAAFPLAATASKATFEIPYGAIERPTTRNNSFEKAKFEVPALRWADEGDGQHGFSLLNNSKYGYDAVGSWLRLSLLRSPTWPDPDADRGQQNFEYFLYPHEGAWQQADTVRQGYDVNYPLSCVTASPHPGDWPREKSFVQVSPDNVVLTAVKKAEDKNALVLRIYESAGRKTDATITFAPGFADAAATNLMEQVSGPARSSADMVTVPLGAWSIETVEVTPQK